MAALHILTASEMKEKLPPRIEVAGISSKELRLIKEFVDTLYSDYYQGNIDNDGWSLQNGDSHNIRKYANSLGSIFITPEMTSYISTLGYEFEVVSHGIKIRIKPTSDLNTDSVGV
jgi:hypothetical protein